MSRPGIAVMLGWPQVTIAVWVGAMRNIASLRQGLRHSHGYDGSDGWSIHIEGAAAEMAVAKFLGLYWEGGVNTFKQGDVGDLQVRWTDKESGRLLIRPRDPLAIYVLAVGRIPEFRVVGWFEYLSARDLRDDWLTDFGNPIRPKVHGVPQFHLRDIEELRERNAYNASLGAESDTHQLGTLEEES